VGVKATGEATARADAFDSVEVEVEKLLGGQ
jgi:hypothetical protein